MDLDSPAADADVLDYESQQPLAAVEVELEETGLVGVKQPRALTVLGVDGGVQALELAGDQLVLVGRAAEHGALAGEQLLWVKQRLADLSEHVLVERVGADRALWTEAVL